MGVARRRGRQMPIGKALDWRVGRAEFGAGERPTRPHVGKNADEQPGWTVRSPETSLSALLASTQPPLPLLIYPGGHLPTLVDPSLTSEAPGRSGRR